MKNKYKVLFLPHNKEVMVEEGENLMDIMRASGIHTESICGGVGVCGKCRMLIEKGDVKGGLFWELSDRDIAKGYRQACLSTIISDMVVRIPKR